MKETGLQIQDQRLHRQQLPFTLPFCSFFDVFEQKYQKRSDSSSSNEKISGFWLSKERAVNVRSCETQHKVSEEETESEADVKPQKCYTIK